MLKRILLALDRSDSGLQAQRLAISLAADLKAQITGVGVLDIPWITAAQPEPLGGTAYKLHRDQEIIHKTHERLKTLLHAFTEDCAKKQVECVSLEAQGIPALELEHLSQEHDIIVMGAAPEFHFEMDSDNHIVVHHIMRDNPRPLLITPAQAKSEGNSIVIAYDGSLQAARALHMFLLLGLARQRALHIISVDGSRGEAEARARMAQRMCASHNIQATAQGFEVAGDPAPLILRAAHEKKAEMIVLGAFGRRGLRELFFGSVASHLIKEADVPLFIHH